MFSHITLGTNDLERARRHHGDRERRRRGRRDGTWCRAARRERRHCQHARLLDVMTRYDQHQSRKPHSQFQTYQTIKRAMLSETRATLEDLQKRLVALRGHL